MRAVVYTEFGELDVLHVGEVEEVHAGPGQVRIGVRAAGVNPFDWKVVTGLMARGERPAGPTVPGVEAAGVVDEVGEGVHGVQAGDPVFGLGGATAAEHAVLRAWVPKPPEVSFEVAAGLAVAGETAVRVLDLLGLPPGRTVVVDGASGGVGTATVQVAVSRGLGVIGTSSATNADFVRSLGALPTTYGEGLVERVREIAPDGVDGAVDTAGRGSVRDLVALTGDPGRAGGQPLLDEGPRVAGQPVGVRTGDDDLAALDAVHLPIVGCVPGGARGRARP